VGARPYKAKRKGVDLESGPLALKDDERRLCNLCFESNIERFNHRERRDPSTPLRVKKAFMPSEDEALN